MLIKHPDGLTHIERNGRAIGYAYDSHDGLTAGLFDGAQTPKGFSKRGLLQWVKRNDQKASRRS